MGKGLNNMIKIIAKSTKSSARKTYNQKSYSSTPDYTPLDCIIGIGIFVWIVVIPGLGLVPEGIWFIIYLITYLISIPFCIILGSYLRHK